MSKEEKFDLEERLVDFAVRIIKVSDSLQNSRVGNHVRGQILRSGTSPFVASVKTASTNRRQPCAPNTP